MKSFRILAVLLVCLQVANATAQGKSSHPRERKINQQIDRNYIAYKALFSMAPPTTFIERQSEMSEVERILNLYMYNFDKAVAAYGATKDRLDSIHEHTGNSVEVQTEINSLNSSLNLLKDQLGEAQQILNFACSVSRYYGYVCRYNSYMNRMYVEIKMAEQ